MARIAAFDLGTNTFLCLIADVTEEVDGFSLKVIEDHARVVRLGQGVHQSKRFSDEALKRADECLSTFTQAVKKLKVDHIVATATSAARDVSNGQALLDLGQKYSIPIKIIPGEKEAALSFQGAISGITESENKNILVIDVGGGSTELIFRKSHEKKIKGESFNVGGVRLTEMFLKSDPVKENEVSELTHYADEKLLAYGHVSVDLVVAVAGTPTTLACVAQEIEFNEEKIEGFNLTSKSLSTLIDDLKNKTVEERKKIKGMVPERADVILAGAILLERSLKLTNKTEMRVSTRGLRFGAALHYRELL